jgi:hypothetical protein
MGIASDLYEGGGHKSVKFNNVGDSVEGELVQLQKRHGKKFGTDNLEYWDNGDPKLTPVLTLQTSLEEDADDDGVRDVWCRSGLFTALGQGLREAYSPAPTDSELIGAHVKVAFTGTAKSKFGTDRKLYHITITPKANPAAAEAYEQPEHPPTQADDEVPF